MGASGLHTHCLHNPHLAKFVTIRPGTFGAESQVKTIAVDFAAFVNFVLNVLGKHAKYGPKLAHVINGEYLIISNAIKYFINSMSYLNIHLHFFLDGSQLSREKIEEWKVRYCQQTHRRDTLVEAMLSNDLASISSEQYIRPMMIEYTFMIEILRQNCKITYCLGEADVEIVKTMLANPEVYLGVLSRDSDFSVFADVKYIVRDWFDRENNLDFVDFKTPEQITFGVLLSNDVHTELGLTLNQMVDLSVLRGNDISRSYVQPMDELLQRGGFMKCVRVIREYGTLENYPNWKQLCKKIAKAAKFIPKSREYYIKLKMDDLKHFKKTHELDLIMKRYYEGSLPYQWVSFVTELFWERIVFEKVEENMPTSEMSLSFFRSLLYGLVLPQKLFAYEMSGSHTALPTKIMIPNNLIDSQLEFDINNLSQNLHFFTDFIQTAFNMPGVDFEDLLKTEYSLDIQLTTIVFSAFIIHCQQFKVPICNNYLKALFITVFARKPLKMIEAFIENSSPIISLPQLKISVYFSNVWRHCVIFLGSICHMSAILPAIDTVFSSSMFCVLSNYYFGQIHSPDMMKLMNEVGDAVLAEYEPLFAYCVRLLNLRMKC